MVTEYAFKEDENMKRYNILQPLYMAFYSKALYRDIGQHWRGSGFLYILLLTAICCIPFVYQIELGIAGLANYSKPIVAQLPTITVKQGQVSIDHAEPYYIKAPGSGRELAIIDTTGKVTSLEDTQAFVLLTKTQLIRKEDNIEKKYTIAPNRNAVYTPELVSAFLEKLTLVIAIAIYPVMVILYFLEGIIEALFYSSVAKLFISTSFSFQTLFRLAAVAMTPGFIIAALFDLINLHIPYRWVVYIPLAVGYLIFAIKANLEANPPHLPS